MMSLFMRVVLMFGVLLFVSPTAYSHSMPPSLLQLEETGDSIYLASRDKCCHR